MRDTTRGIRAPRNIALGLLNRTARAAGFVLKRPAATAALVLALGTATGVALNATVLQKGHHPAPLIATRAPEKPEFRVLPQAKPVPPPALKAERTDPEPTKSVQPQPAKPTQPLSKADLVKAIQTELRARRLYAGKVDGALGPRTAQAIRAYEKHENLPETGKPSEALLKLLRAPKKGPVPSAAVVASVQKVLTSLGYGPLKVDGTLHPDMRQAIERFELDRGLPVTGRINERLIHELKRITGASIG